MNGPRTQGEALITYSCLVTCSDESSGSSVDHVRVWRGIGGVLASLTTMVKECINNTQIIETTFQLMQRWFGQLEIRIMASPKNRKTNIFIRPFHHHPDCVSQNILLAQWNQWKSIYIFPPPPQMLVSHHPQFRTFKGKGLAYLCSLTVITFLVHNSEKNTIGFTQLGKMKKKSGGLILS